MTSLEQAIDQVRAKIGRYRGLNINEQNTKAGLVDPVLRALGWDVEGLEEVQREFKVQSGHNPVDYALMDRRTSAPLLLIEAKALDENLDDSKWAGQIMSYANVARVRWVVLTNGDEYRIYNAHAGGFLEQKLFRAIQISDPNAEVETTLALLGRSELERNTISAIWETESLDQRLKTTIQSLFTPEPDEPLVELVKQRMPGLTAADVRAGFQRLRVHFDISTDHPAPSVAQTARLAPDSTPDRGVSETKREGATGQLAEQEQPVQHATLDTEGAMTPGLSGDMRLKSQVFPVIRELIFSESPRLDRPVSRDDLGPRLKDRPEISGVLRNHYEGEVRKMDFDRYCRNLVKWYGADWTKLEKGQLRTEEEEEMVRSAIRGVRRFHLPKGKRGWHYEPETAC